jgi:hypothetical protein
LRRLRSATSSRLGTRHRKRRNRSAIGSTPIVAVASPGGANDTHGLHSRLKSRSRGCRSQEAPYPRRVQQQHDCPVFCRSKPQRPPTWQKPEEFQARLSVFVASRSHLHQPQATFQFFNRQSSHANYFPAPGLAGSNGNGRSGHLQKFREEFDAGLIGAAFYGRRG